MRAFFEQQRLCVKFDLGVDGVQPGDVDRFARPAVLAPAARSPAARSPGVRGPAGWPAPTGLHRRGQGQLAGGQLDNERRLGAGKIGAQPAGDIGRSQASGEIGDLERWCAAGNPALDVDGAQALPDLGPGRQGLNQPAQIGMAKTNPQVNAGHHQCEAAQVGGKAAGQRGRAEVAGEAGDLDPGRRTAQAERQVHTSQVRTERRPDI